MGKTLRKFSKKGKKTQQRRKTKGKKPIRRKSVRRGRKTGGDPNAWWTVAVGVENAIDKIIKEKNNEAAVNELDSLLKDKSTLFDWSGSCSGDIKCELQKSHNYAKAKELAKLLNEHDLENELNNKITRKKANKAVSTDDAFTKHELEVLRQAIEENKQPNMQKVKKSVQKLPNPGYLSVNKGDIKNDNLAAYLNTTYGDNFTKLNIFETAMSCHSDATGGSNYNYFPALKNDWKYTLCDVIDISRGKGQLTDVFKIRVQQGQAGNATIKVPKTKNELLNPSTIRS